VLSFSLADESYWENLWQQIPIFFKLPSLGREREKKESEKEIRKENVSSFDASPNEKVNDIANGGKQKEKDKKKKYKPKFVALYFSLIICNVPCRSKRLSLLLTWISSVLSVSTVFLFLYFAYSMFSFRLETSKDLPIMEKYFPLSLS
jgi:hypothetical protein